MGRPERRVIKVYQISNQFDSARPQESIPGHLRRLRRWVPWRYGTTRKNGGQEKAPIDHRTGKPADVTDAEAWCSYPEAARYAREHHLDGIGFVFMSDDPYCGIDLDDCRDPKTGELDSKALEILDSLDSYAEISPSGSGIKVIVRATKPGRACRTPRTPWGGSLEVYDRERFFTVTGDVFMSRPVGDAQSAVERLYGPGGYLLSTVPRRALQRLLETSQTPLRSMRDFRKPGTIPRPERSSGNSTILVIGRIFRARARPISTCSSRSLSGWAGT
jgi:primase-polymerase (primpol)-like protein